VQKLLLREFCAKPTRRLSGKADDLWEETSMRTIDSTVIGGQTSKERFVEITSGRTITQQGLTATCKDPPHKAHCVEAGGEGDGLAHESI